jgi:hypothetical protein
MREGKSRWKRNDRKERTRRLTSEIKVKEKK